MRQLAFYKLLWERNMRYGRITHARYINPRTQVYETIRFPQDITMTVLSDVSTMRCAIRDGTFKYQCNPVKYIICRLCDADECGVFDDAKGP